MKTLTLPVYSAWVSAWRSTATEADPLQTPLPLDEQVRLFKKETSASFPNHTNLKRLVHSFRHSLRTGEITLGGRSPPSNEITNLASENYNPSIPCHCQGLYPLPADTSILTVLSQTQCAAIQHTLNALNTVLTHQSEWNPTTFWTPHKLQQAITELILANSDRQAPPSTCQGSVPIPPILAPDRRPNPQTDTKPDIHSQLYPTAEAVKFCVDAKHYFVLAAAPAGINDGIIRAIADSGNDILIADYADVADESTLLLLQRTGAAAVAFLKFCVLTGSLTAWQFDTLMASMLHFRVLGYYRDHGREQLPGGLYGSRMTGLLVHRFSDLSIFPAIAAASSITGEQISEEENLRLNEACTLINDLVDLRSDTARRQRENVVLRGVRGGESLCLYLDGLIARCLEAAGWVVGRPNRTAAMALMAFCNWAVMASHHKVYEVVKGVEEVGRHAECVYRSKQEGGYEGLLEGLKQFGTLGEGGPSVFRTRADMDLQYGTCRVSEKEHLAWLADVTRSLLDPNTLRKIVDVVHYEWKGNVGDVDYCP